METYEILLIILVILGAITALCAIIIAKNLSKPTPINVVTLPGVASVPQIPVQAPTPAVYSTAPSAPAVSPAAVIPSREVKLNGVPDRIAAQLMAIVAEESGIPAAELRFISIRERS